MMYVLDIGFHKCVDPMKYCVLCAGAAAEQEDKDHELQSFRGHPHHFVVRGR